jgi:threonine/homoserine/homoserine lactone efflux protein|tara:strand:+ start:4085 stop:4660 length:576 start_codon:yes stop_codon:yes gene_type:complete
MLIFTLPVSFLPGPNNLLSAVHSSKFGFNKTLPLISGMVIGWFLLGVVVGFGALFIEKDSTLLTALTYIGVSYMIYLSYKITFSLSTEDSNISSEELGINTGIILQIVNGKAFIHLLILMTVFGTAFGTDIMGKMIIALLNVSIKLMGWITWALFGSALKIKFNDARSGVLINRAFGFSLFCVAIWIAIPR